MAAPIGNFQAELENTLKTHATQDVIRNLKQLCNEHDVFKTMSKLSVCDSDWICSYFTDCDRLHIKSIDNAGHYKTEGNQAFQKKKYDEAVSKYTLAVVNAPASTEQLALAFGNRSAALFRQNKYQDCVGDINAAMDTVQLPQATLHKLLLRKCHCLQQVLNKDEISTCIESVKKMLAESTVNDPKTDELKNEIRCLEAKNATSSSKVEPMTDIASVSHGPNTVLTQASTAVCLQYTQEKGRHLIANMEINAGDTLIVERPYAGVLLPDHYLTHCHHCYKKLGVQYPCRRCTLVRYCSVLCSTNSWDVYHHIECCYLKLLHSVGIAHLALRIVIVSGLQYLLDYGRKGDSGCDNEQHVPGLDEYGVYCRSYKAVYDLMTHIDHIPPPDIAQYTLTAQLLLKILVHSGWFNQETTHQSNHGDRVSEPQGIGGQTADAVTDSDFSKHEIPTDKTTHACGDEDVAEKHFVNRNETTISKEKLQSNENLKSNEYLKSKEMLKSNENLKSNEMLTSNENWPSKEKSKSNEKLKSDEYLKSNEMLTSNEKLQSNEMLKSRHDDGATAVIEGLGELDDGQTYIEGLGELDDGQTYIEGLGELDDGQTYIEGLGELDDRQTYIGAILLRHILQLVCNAHAITQLQCSELKRSHVVEEMSQVRIATAIYPTASLMNHSCDPTIISSFHGDELVVRAIKDVPVGGEVFNCYGPHCKKMGYHERQQSLKEQYFFTCQCQPCSQGQQEELVAMSYRCRECSGPVYSEDMQTSCFCSNCNCPVTMDTRAIQQADDTFHAGLQYLQENKLTECVQALGQCLSIRREHLYKWNRQLAETLDLLARAYATQGNFKEAGKHLQDSIAIIEHIYGTTSIELANELQKLSEILISSQSWRDALSTNQRASELFTLHYGKSHDSVKELGCARKELVEIIEALHL